MGVVYYKYKSEKEVYSMPVPHSSISVSEFKRLILTSDRHGRGRTRGRGPREGIAISNAQTGEDYTDENAMIQQNTTVLVRRVAGQLLENIVLVSSQNVTEDCSLPSNKSVLTDSNSKSFSSTEEQDEDAAITAVIDAAELKLEDHQSKKGQAGGRFTSGSCYGYGKLEGETPPPGYVCRSCRIPGHFIQHCTQENKTPPPGYICYRCRVPGHFIQHCPTIGDPNLDKNKMTRSLVPVVTPNPVDGILESLVSAASASAVDDLPAELHCQLCKKVMTDAVLTSKCCFDSFCDKCIRDYIITQSKCICGAKVLADSLIPNHTLRSTISNMLSTRACSTTSGTTMHRSSSGSNPDPKLQSHAPSASSELEEMKKPMDHHVSEAAAPDDGIQVATEDDLNQPLEKLATDVDHLSKGEVSSAEMSVEKVVASAENLKLQDGSESALKVTAVSGTLEHNGTRTDQPKRKRKKEGSTTIVQPNNADFGYNIPVDPAYYNPYVGGYPWITEPFMYGGYPMDPYGVNFMNSMPPQAFPMNGYPPNYYWHGAQPTLQRGTETAARSRLSERPKDTCNQSRLSECHRQRGSSHGSELRNRKRLSPERRDHQRSDRVSDDYYEDHSRKRKHVSSPLDVDKHSSRSSRHSSRSMMREDSSDDERNFKRRWGRRSSVTVD